MSLQIAFIVWSIGLTGLFFKATRWKVLKWSAVFWVGLITCFAFAPLLGWLGYVMVWSWLAVLALLPAYWVVRALQERQAA